MSFAILKEKTVKVSKVLDNLGELLTTFLNQNQEKDQSVKLDDGSTGRKATILTSARDPNSQTAYKYFSINSNSLKEDLSNRTKSGVKQHMDELKVFFSQRRASSVLTDYQQTGCDPIS